MSKPKSYPTRISDRQKRSESAVAERRSTPDIWVRVPFSNKGYRDHEYRHAHLRNKAGYLYLCWRDGEGVHSHYLGKAPKPCPTLEYPIAPAAELDLVAGGRAKNRR